MPIQVFLRNHRSWFSNVYATNKPFSYFLWPCCFLTCLILVYCSMDILCLLLSLLLASIHHHIFYSMNEFRMGLLLFLFCCLFLVLVLQTCDIYRYNMFYLSLVGSLTLSHIPHCVFVCIYVCLFVIALFA
jgi:hypothetical protein